MRVVIGIGSNLSNGMEKVADAISFLTGILRNISSSGIYSTNAIGNSHGVYFNAVAEGEYSGNIEALESELKDYEICNGRDDAARIKGVVPIDLDVVVSDDCVLRPQDYDRSYFRYGYNQLPHFSDQG